MSCPAPRSYAVMRAVRPVAEPLMTRLPTSTLTTGGRLTVCALPRVHDAGPVQAYTVSILHIMGAEPSYGAAAYVTDAPTNRQRLVTSTGVLTAILPADFLSARSVDHRVASTTIGPSP